MNEAPAEGGEAQEPPYDTFISYASADRVVAERLRDALIDQGLRPWVAFVDIAGGSDYPAEIVKAIAMCRTLVLLVSNESVKSKHVRREVGTASSRDRRILPVYLDNTVPLPEDLEYHLHGLHRLKVKPAEIEAAAAKIAAGVRHHERWLTDASAPGLVESLATSPRRAWAGLLAISVLAGLLVWGLQGLWADHAERSRQEGLEDLPDSLALVQLRSATRPASGPGGKLPWSLKADVTLVEADLAFSQVRLELASRSEASAASDVFDLTTAFNGRQLGGGQMLTVEVPRLGAIVTTCLSLPHRQRSERWRLTEVFDARHETDEGGNERVIFSRSAAPRAAKDEGQACQ